MPALVTEDELVRTNTVISTGGDLARLIGAAAGGIVLETIGLHGVVAVDAATFVAAALLLAVRFPRTTPPPGQVEHGGLFARWRAGLSAVRRTAGIRNCFVLVLLNQLAQGIALALIVAFLVADLHQGSAAVGVFRRSSRS